ncbi:MAG TPA: alpha/beta hydrolase [Mycobacteriales bacterium]|nr:alpha/beta hydrolase [Mycobacteriales bacterium]
MTTSPDVRREVVRIRDVDVDVSIYGTSGVPVVLMPGGAVACSGYFPDLVEGLAGQTVIVHDRLGTGTSRTAEPISVRSWSDDTATLLDGLGIERALLVGHSLGGALAAQVLLDHPERVAGVLLLDPTPLNDRPLCTRASKGAAALARLCRLPLVGGGFEALLKRSGRPRRLRPSARQSFDRTFSGSWLEDTAASVRLLIEDADAFCAREVSPTRVPALLVSADRKPTNKARIAHTELAAMLGARLEIWPKTQHSLHLQKPDLVVTRTRELLESC